ncbi:MAG: N-acetylornithine carbamoyltransferase [Cyclobacteriaceae bacterium]|nr:N-acetylornithine carbamoyltransferase [Cyclobacteriaceae bacterium]
MKQFLSVDDVADPMGVAREAIQLKSNPFQYQDMGKNKTLGLVFFNPSLRTRMSTARAAYNLGMHVMVLNVSQDSWQLETEDGVIMDGGKAEHIREAAAVMGSYCEILGVRSFPTLTDREKDYSEYLLNAFARHAGVPIINMESATVHPLQSLADLMTIEEHAQNKRPKVVLTWAPHVKALPQAVPNSFAQWMNRAPVDFVITHPKGMELAPEFSGQAGIEYDQSKALEGADFIYVKNWSSYHDYGHLYQAREWMMSLDKLKNTHNARVMHCLPVRRNVVIDDAVLDSNHSIVQQQAANRVYAAQIVIKKLLEAL